MSKSSGDRPVILRALSKQPKPTELAAQLDKATAAENDSFSKLIHWTAREAPRLLEDVYAQGDVAIKLAEYWNQPAFGDRRRAEAFNLLQGAISRLKQFSVGKRREVWDQIMALPGDADIREALRVHPDLYPPYKPEPGEELYSRVEGWLGDYLDYVKHNQVPLGFHFWSGAFVMGACAKRNIYAETGIERLFLNQYINLVGPSGCGKSAAMNSALHLVDVVNRQIEERFKPYSREYRIHRLAEDSTQESVMEDLANLNNLRYKDANGTIIARRVDAAAIMALDEMATHYGKDNWNVGKKAPFWTTIYSKDTHTKSTRKDGLVTVNGLCVSFIACAAPEWLKGTIDKTVLKGGLADRSLYIYRPEVLARDYDPFSIPPKDPLRAQLLAQELLEWVRPEPFLMRPARIDSVARSYVQAEYKKERDRQRSGDRAKRATIVRSYAHVIKVAVILSMSTRDFPWVTIDHLQLAEDIITAEEKTTRRFLGIISERDDADIYTELDSYITQKGGMVTGTQLVQRFKYKLHTKENIMRYVDTLRAGSWIDATIRGKKGFKKVADLDSFRMDDEDDEPEGA